MYVDNARVNIDELIHVHIVISNTSGSCTKGLAL